MINKNNSSSTDNTLDGSSVKNSDDRAHQHDEETQQLQNNFLLDDTEYHSDKKNASLRLMIPTYLDNQLTQIAASKRVTKRFLILKALAQAGYHLEKEDLVTDKRRVR